MTEQQAQMLIEIGMEQVRLQGQVMTDLHDLLYLGCVLIGVVLFIAIQNAFRL